MHLPWRGGGACVLVTIPQAMSAGTSVPGSSKQAEQVVGGGARLSDACNGVPVSRGWEKT